MDKRDRQPPIEERPRQREERRGIWRDYGEREFQGSPYDGGRSYDPHHPQRAADARAEASDRLGVGEWYRSLRERYPHVAGTHAEPTLQGSHGEMGRFFGFRGADTRRPFRGPKGYKRSDERILDEVCVRLARQHDVDPTDMEVAVSAGEVTLSGIARSRYEKLRAEAIADSVLGVTEVHNRVRVERD